MVVGFILVRFVHSGAPWASQGSFGFVGFIRARLMGGRVYKGSLGLFGRSLAGRRVDL